MEDVLKTFSWNRVRYCLDRIDEMYSYYVGGSLCFYMQYAGYIIVLNRDGRGLMLKNGREIKFLMPKDVQDTVIRIYEKNKVKGELDG